MPITIEAAAEGLNQVVRTYGAQIHQAARIGLEWEQQLPMRATDKIHVEANVSLAEILQPYQWQFTPKGGADYDAVENELQIIKADVKLTADDIAQFWDSWKAEWYDVGLVKQDPVKYSFAMYLYETQYGDKMMEELNQMMWSGEHAAPTPGTPGASLTSMDGFRKKIGDAVAGGQLSEIPTGAILSGSIVDQVEAFCDAMPPQYRDLPGHIRMSSTNATRYARNYRGLFGTGNGVAGNENNELRVDFTKKRIKPMASMDVTNSDRFIFVPDGLPGLIWGVRRGFPQHIKLRWESTERIVKGLGETYRFAGATYWEFVFVNDQD